MLMSQLAATTEAGSCSLLAAHGRSLPGHGYLWSTMLSVILRVSGDAECL